MKNLQSSIIQKRKEKYLKLQNRFLTSLKKGGFDDKSGRSKHHWIQKLKKLERQLGLVSNLNLKHWALAFTLGFVTIAGNVHAQQKETSIFKHKNELRKFNISRKGVNNARAQAVAIFSEQPLIGDPLAGEVAKGDFDGDGDIDFISFGYYSAAFLFQNDGSGNFSTPTAVWTPSYGLEEYVVGDIDGDGDLDIVVAEENNSDQSRMVYLINDGSGIFTESVGTFGPERESLDLVDIDNDGDLDLILNEDVGSYTFNVKVLTNDSFGAFTEASTLSFLVNQYDWEFGQMTADAFADIVYIDSDTVRVFINDGAGGFTQGSSIKTKLTAYDKRLGLIVDLDADGDDDIVTQDNELGWLENDGTGSFTHAEIKNRGGSYPYIVFNQSIVADFDGDSNNDIFVWENLSSNPRGSGKLFINDGTEIFSQAGDSVQLSANIYSPALVHFDLDGDLDEDIMASTYFDFELFANDADGIFTPAGSDLIDVFYGTDIEPIDLDGDSDLDIVMGGYTPRVLINNGDATFTNGQEFIAAADDELSEVEARDFDGDSDIDLVFSDNETNEIHLWLNNGTNTFTAQSSFATSNDSDNIRGLLSGNIDNLNGFDIVTYVQNDTSNVLNHFDIWKNDGAGTLTTSPFSTTHADIEDVQLADIDGDGDLDIITAANYDGLNTYINDGAGNFTSGTQNIPTGINTRVNYITVVDIDNDSDSDIVAAGKDNDVTTAFLFLNDGTGSFTSSAIATPTAYLGPYAADFDLDGDIDLVFGGEEYNDEVWLNDGTNSFVLEGSLDSKSYGMAIADLDNDGDTDLFTLESYLGNRVILNNTNQVSMLELDSAQLVTFYDETGGDTWTNNTNWKTGDVSTWFGVTVVSDRVTAIDLNNNNLTGVFTVNAGLDSLTTLDLSGNLLTGIPDLSGTNITTLDVSDNQLQFGSLENNAGITSINYTSQAEIGTVDFVLVKVDSLHTLSIAVTGTANQYQWFKDAAEITGATNTSHAVGPFSIADNGDYHCEVTNTIATGLTISSAISTLQQESLLELDSIQLVQLYNETGGADWTDNTGWLSGDVSTWFGVTVVTDRVTAIDLNNNNLTGVITVNSDLDSLITLNLSGNLLTGIPDLSATNITSLDVSDNHLQFGSLENNAGITSINYTSQAEIGTADFVLVKVDSLHTLSIAVTGTANQYQWFKDAAEITGATNTSHAVGPFSTANNGDYHCEVTNTIATGLTISSAISTLQQESLLELDSIQLVQLYTETGGADWTDNTDWLSGDVSTWFGVTVTDDRVSSVLLNNNNLTGAITVNTDLDDLLTLDVSGNAITSIPDWTGTNMTSIDVSVNNLEFGSLEPNAAIPGINYANQGLIGTAISETLEARTEYQMSITTSGVENMYQWYQDGVAISAATGAMHTLPSIRTEDVGDYYCEVTNGIVTGLTLTTQITVIEAYASISGTVLVNETTQLSAGEILLLRVIDTDGYDSTSTFSLGGDGTYIHTNAPLGEYITLAKPDTITFSNSLPTYWGQLTNTIYWEEADTIRLDSTIVNLDILLQGVPADKPAGDGIISGLLEEDVPDGGRIEAKKRVSGAGVSVRRVKKQGKGEEDELELVAYIYTNTNGEFVFENLEEDNYKLNIQYPGFPMDPNSFIDIPIGTGNDSEVVIEALAANGKIVVTEISITGIYDNKNFSGIKVYPNPSSERMFIEGELLNETELMVVLHAVDGKKINAINKKVVALNAEGIDISRLEKGVYILEVYTLDNQLINTTRIEISNK